MVQSVNKSSNQSLNNQELQDTLKFFTEFNYYNYYSLNFIRFYAKKASKLVGYSKANDKFYNLIETILTLKSEGGDNTESLVAVLELAQAVQNNNIENTLCAIFTNKFTNLSPKQKAEFAASLLDFAKVYGIKIDSTTSDSSQQAINEFKNNGSFYKTLTLGKIFAIVCALAVSMTEAISSVYFMGVYTMGALLSIGLPSFAVNFLLFYPDLKKLICSSEDNSKSSKSNPNFLVKFGLPFAAVAAGVMTAFVALNSMLETFGTIFFGLSPALALTAPPLGLITFVSVFAFASFLANTALLLNGFSFNNLTYFFPKEEGKANVLTRLYNNFSSIIIGLQTNNVSLISKSTGKLILDLSLIGAAVALAASIYMSSLGVFQTQAIKTLTSVFGLSEGLSSLISIVSVQYCGQFLNGLFYVDKILYPLNYLANSLFNDVIGNSSNIDITDKVKIQIAKSEILKNIKQDSFDKEIISINNAASASNAVPSLGLGLVMGCIGYFSWINGYSQGEGFAKDPLSNSGLQWLSFGLLTSKSASLYAYCLGTLGSFIANYNNSYVFLTSDSSKEQLQNQKKLKA